MHPRLALPFLALAALALAPAALAQDPPTFGQAYQVRGGLGDIPTTPETEVAGQFHLQQSLEVRHSAGSTTVQRFHVPLGLNATGHACGGCNATLSSDGDVARVSIPAEEPAGTYRISVTASAAVGDAFGYSFAIPAGVDRADAIVILYAPTGTAVQAPVEPGEVLPATGGSATIHSYAGTAEAPLPSVFWFTVAPGEAAAPAPGGKDAGFPWLAFAGGAVLGVVLWALLVQKGLVQRRARKQVATIAAHHEVAAKDPTPVLEGRRRALMAALKEIELARQGNEIDVPTYDALKADFKRQTVTVMRAIEEGKGK